jgi:hypothetical protein
MNLALLLKKPMWLYAAVSAMAVVLMAAVSAVWAPQLSQWEESAWPAAHGHCPIKMLPSDAWSW